MSGTLYLMITVIVSSYPTHTSYGSYNKTWRSNRNMEIFFKLPPYSGSPLGAIRPQTQYYILLETLMDASVTSYFLALCDMWD